MGLGLKMGCQANEIKFRRVNLGTVSDNFGESNTYNQKTVTRTFYLQSASKNYKVLNNNNFGVAEIAFNCYKNQGVNGNNGSSDSLSWSYNASTAALTVYIKLAATYSGASVSFNVYLYESYQE